MRHHAEKHYQCGEKVSVIRKTFLGVKGTVWGVLCISDQWSMISWSASSLLDRLAEPVWVFGRTDGGKRSAWEADVFPHVLQFFLPTVNSKNIDNTDKVSTVRSVYHVNAVSAVGQQPAMMLVEILQFWVSLSCLWTVYLLQDDPVLFGPAGCSIQHHMTCWLLQ